VRDDVSGYPGAPPDWYADPAGGPGKRWWDGYTWSDAVVLPSEPPLQPGAALPGYGAPGDPGAGYGSGAAPSWGAAQAFGNPSALLDTQLRVSRQARVAVVVIGIYFLWEYIVLRLQKGFFRSLGHQYHLVIIASQHNRKAPAFHANGGFSPIGDLIALATIAAVVVACIWQHRAASTARALGYPSTHSPSWGVGCWFVPVVAIWMPYQALRDCLPPGDPNRALVKRFWLYFVGQGFLATAAFVAALFSTSVSLAFCVPGALLCLGMLYTSPQVVAAITSAHQAALGRGGTGTPMSG
jgi:hypothetical protein